MTPGALIHGDQVQSGLGARIRYRSVVKTVFYQGRPQRRD